MLKTQPKISTNPLAYLLGIRRQTLNELLGRLKKKVVLSASPRGEDKRVTLVCITEKGKNVHQPESDFHDMFECLSSNELYFALIFILAKDMFN